MSVLDNEGGAVREKVQQLEDAHTLQVVNPKIQFLANLETVHIQVEKVHYVEALGSRVNMIEAERQQSEARVKEEVNVSLGQKMGVVDQVG